VSLYLDADIWHDKCLLLFRPTIEQYNQIAPDPARLTKKVSTSRITLQRLQVRLYCIQRVILATKDKPFAYGEKGMPRRKDVIKDYSDEIGKLV